MAKVRSPSFPFISLPEAVHRARELYESERRNLVHPDVAVASWGYSPRSSGGKQTIAALRAYGFLEDVRGDLRLTDRAQHVLVRESGSAERGELLRQAALSPPVFARLWERYGADLPSDRSLRSYLVLEMKFNEGSVDDALRSYRETLAHAGLLPDSPSPAPAALQVPPAPAAPETPTEPSAPPAPETPRELTLSFPLGDNWGELRIRRRVRPDEAETLRKLFELWLDQVREKEGG